MKNLIFILCMMLVVVSCSKKSIEPCIVESNTASNQPTLLPITFTTTCDSSNFTYQIKFDTAVTTPISIYYKNSFGILTNAVVTSGNSWHQSINFGGIHYVSDLIMTWDVNYPTNMSMTLEIYREGYLVQTSGLIEYCTMGTGICSNTSIDYISLKYDCQ